jgi:DNA-binding transcriptional LysR family regulator
MTLTQVRYALEVNRCHQFSKAAENLFVSQPALSLQIRKLEQELGYPLFVRSSAGVLPTPEGEKFLKEARKAADAWDEFCNTVQNRRRPGGHLAIGLGARVYSNGLFDAVSGYFRRYPDMDVTFSTEGSHNFFQDLLDGKLDLALDRWPPRSLVPEPDSFFCLDLISERQCVLVSALNPLHREKEVPFTALDGAVFTTCLKDSMDEKILHYDCEKYGIHPQRLFYSDGVDTNMNLVRNGLALSFGPISFADYYGVAAVPLSPEINVSLSFFCLKESINRPEIRAFCSYLDNICREKTAHSSASPAR